uniref:VWFA domain-containing protein n=1 Tax=Panagrolaimus sp. JU765 TaxID=591449 RepID=A0AC34Q4Y3_9BILA
MNKLLCFLLVAEIALAAAAPADPLKCRPANLVFVLDTSQSIDGSFYNSTVRAFVKKIASGYPMKGEINGASSRIGIVQFASDALLLCFLLVAEIALAAAAPADPLKCRPANLVFVLDTSQSIDGSFYNSTVRAFVKKIASGYPMKGEINGPSSRIGIVQFASDALVTYPMIERTRQEFLATIDQGIFYSDEGITSMSLGLETTVKELDHKGINKNDNLMVILVTDGVSTLDIRQTKPAADKVREYTKFFAGVGIDGINGNDISANLANLITLIGNGDLAYPDIAHAEDLVNGIWPESRKIYPMSFLQLMKAKKLVFSLITKLFLKLYTS